MGLVYRKSRYAVDDTLAIKAWKDGEPCCDVSVNISAYYRLPLSDDMIVIPKYKMDKELYDEIVSDIVEKECTSYFIGYNNSCEVVLARLKDGWEKKVSMKE